MQAGYQYLDAVLLLESRRRSKRPDTRETSRAGQLDRIPDAKGHLDVRGTPSIQGMSEWLELLGHSPDKVDELNVIHVAGTKGKGSTCAFIESFLRAYGQRTGFPRKTGMYTSPHLIHPEERIRIDSRPLPRPLFAKYFFEVWDLLSDGKHVPRYLQLCALFATHVFLREGVDATVFETHHGGEYDATNFFQKPIVTIITPLGMDHAKQLGPTLRNIAWHKAGIFKQGAIAWSAFQSPEAAAVLRDRAAEKAVSLHFQQQDPWLLFKALEIPENALQLKPYISQPESIDFNKGVAQFSWPGRFQYIDRGSSQWFLDGAHNEMSVVKAAEWFIEAADLVREIPSTPRALIFAHDSQQRNPVDVIVKLATSLAPIRFDHIIWRYYQPDSVVVVTSTTNEAMGMAEDVSKRVGGLQTLITGSLHLVGGCLRHLTTSCAEKDGESIASEGKGTEER
ncbi:folylpolyglutamate synthase [Xylariomycetidae sp. FL0641]|nr:folylpolyglutamate synthase [Xylariomycetidae sp. FL0641]